MAEGGNGSVEARLRPGPWWRAVVCGELALLLVAASGAGFVDGDPFLTAIVVVGVVFGLWQQFAWVSVGADGISRRWIRTRRWGWHEITGIGWTGMQAWRFRTAGGKWKPVTPWKALLVTTHRTAERRFIDAFVRNAAMAGFTPVDVPPWPRADLSRAVPGVPADGPASPP